MLMKPTPMEIDERFRTTNCSVCKHPFLRLGNDRLRVCPDCAENFPPPPEVLEVDVFMASRSRSRLGLRHLDTLDFDVARE